MKYYIDEFIKLKSAPDMLTMKLFPNAKEITENMGAYKAVSRYIIGEPRVRWDNESVAVVSVGDGHRPRTAALFAFRSAWQCWSIDPVMRPGPYPIKRLSIIKDKVENIYLPLDNFAAVIIVMVHSHAKIADTLEHIAPAHARRHVISIPCCVPHDISGKEYIGYVDDNIWSDKNTVKIWRFV